MPKNLIERAKQAFLADRVIEDAELVVIAEKMDDTKGSRHIGRIVLLLGFAIFFLWAIFAPLNEGVPASGTFTVASQRKTVQHLSGGIVKIIHVKEAQAVKAGEPLITLDDTMAVANFDVAKQQFYSLQSQADRLEAEANGLPTLTFSPALLAAGEDPVAASYIATQQRLFLTRRVALQGEIAMLTQASHSAEQQISGLEAQLAGKREQLKFVTEQLAGTRELAKDGYLPRNRWFEEERMAADLSASVAELQSTVLRAKSMTLEAKQRLNQRQRDFQKEVESQLADVRREALVAANRLRASKEEFERTIIRAPADGSVVGLAAHSVGGVIPPGGRLMDVIPKGEALVLEISVPSHLIDHVHAGLPADVQLHAFPDAPSLILQGKVDSVSADIMPSNNPQMPPFYLGRVSITEEGMKTLGARVIQPGMPAEVVVITGERTFIQYLLKPLRMRLAGSLKES